MLRGYCWVVLALTIGCTAEKRIIDDTGLGPAGFQVPEDAGAGYGSTEGDVPLTDSGTDTGGDTGSATEPGTTDASTGDVSGPDLGETTTGQDTSGAEDATTGTTDDQGTTDDGSETTTGGDDLPDPCVIAASIQAGKEVNASLVAADKALKKYGCASLAAEVWDGPDRVYELMPACTGAHAATLTLAPGSGAGFLALALLSTCDDKACTKGAVTEGGSASISFEATEGQPLMLAVDSFAEAPGVYSLLVEEVGCDKAGDRCDNPLAVDSAPFSDTQDLTALADDLNVGSLCGGGSAAGMGTPDVVYEFVPAVSGVYTVAAAGAVIAVTSDCNAAVCVGWAADQLAIELAAGTSYSIVVDAETSATTTISAACVPDCGAKVCGANSCGTSCGECFAGSTCLSGLCIPDGEDCSLPLTIATAPTVVAGDLAPYQDDYTTADLCGGAASGGDGPDVVYEFTPAASGVYTIGSGGSVSSLTVTSACGTPDCVATGPGTVVTALEAGTTYHVIGDGQSGQYSLTVSGACTPDCGGKSCGPDACGLSCGDCGDGDICTGTGECAGPGEDCALAIQAPAAPWTLSLDNTDGVDAISTADCPGTAGSAGQPDVIVSFTPEITGNYELGIPAYAGGVGPSIVSVHDGCGSGSTCLAFQDFFNESAPMELTLTAGTEYTIVLSSFGTNEQGAQTLLMEPGAPPGDTCAAPLAVSLGDVDTTDLSDDASSGPGCAGGLGAGDPDVYFTWTAMSAGTFPLWLSGSATLLSAFADCANAAGTCAGFADAPTEAAPLLLDAIAGQTFVLLVDGAGGPSAVHVGAPLGDTCDTALPLTLNATATGDTSPFADDYSNAAMGCENAETSAATPPTDAGAGASDVVYRFLAKLGGTYQFALGHEGELGHPYKLSFKLECAAETLCIDSPDLYDGGSLAVNMTAGTEAFVIVDGFFSDDIGPYELTATQSCTAQCDGKQCGDNGCGFHCGSCAEAQTCSDAGQCQDPGTPLDTCAEAEVILPSQLPFTGEGDTSTLADDYSTAGMCGDTAPHGNGYKDAVYSFTPTESGTYTVAYTHTGTGHPWQIYAVTDCAAITETSCLGTSGDLFIADSAAFELTAGQTVFLILDGWLSGDEGPYTFTLEGPAN